MTAIPLALHADVLVETARGAWGSAAAVVACDARTADLLAGLRALLEANARA
jgi:hypothetical protein